VRFEFPLKPRQRRLVEHPARILWNGSGTKTGKTAACLFWLIQAMLRGEKTAWVAPWFLRSRAAFDIAKGMLAPFVASRQVQVREAMPLRITSTNGGSVDFYSADNPQSLYGANYSKVVVDEASRCPEEIFAAALTVISATNGKVRFCFNLELGKRNWAIRNLLRVQALSPEERERTGEDFMTWPTGGDAEDNLVDPSLIEMLRSKMPELLWKSLYLAEIPESDTSLFRNLDRVFQGRELAGPVEGDSYICGIDLGRKQDWTVCTIINEAGEVVAAERFSQISWTLQASRCASLYMQFKCKEAHCDASGIGDPITEEFEKLGMVVKPFIFSQPSRKALLEELVVSCDGMEIRVPSTGEVFRTMRQELEAMECVLDGASVKYSAPPSMHDDCVMSLALATHGWRQSRGMVLGVLDYAKRLLKEIAEGARDVYGELVSKLTPASKPKPVTVLVPKDVQAAEARVANYERLKEEPGLCPVCNTKNVGIHPDGHFKTLCKQCAAVNGVAPAKPVNGNKCPECDLPLVWSGGMLRCQNHGQIPTAGNPSGGMTFKQYENRRRNTFGRFGGG
jgi:hypothetical protein